MKFAVAMFFFSTLGSMVTASVVTGQEYLNGIGWDAPPIVQPGDTAADPPSDAMILFDGKDMSAWNDAETWKVEEGTVIVGSKQITSKESFGDCQLHVEWSAPSPPKGDGQGRGNSGIFFMDRYEIQVLDSYNNETYHDGQAGAIYKQTPPAVNAMRPPGQWNTYDVFWTAPRFNEDGQLESPAYITAVHNGVLILNHFELLGDTPYTRPPQYTTHPPTGPIRIQDHGNPVRYRNIWVRAFKPTTGQQVEPPFTRDSKTGKKTPLE